MKLAEALQERADLNRKISQLETRLLENSFTQDGVEPAQDPKKLLEELDRCISRMEQLIAAINKANTATIVDGSSLTELIARKDCLALEIGVLNSVIGSASGAITRYTRSEIKIVRMVDVSSLQKKADRLSKEVREVDNKLQQANWTTEIDI